MSTLKSIRRASAKIDLDADNKGIEVFGFSAKHISDLLDTFPDLTEAFREIKLAQAQAAAQKKEFTIVDLVSVAVDKAMGAVSNGAVALAVVYALREDVSTDEAFQEAMQAASELTLEAQIAIIVAAFGVTMPAMAANFRKAMASSTTSTSGNAIA
jgi:hypothetical protein